MAVRPSSLSLENLESRLNLSGLGGLVSVTPAAPGVLTQENSILNNLRKATTLTDHTRVQLFTNAQGKITSTSFGVQLKEPASLSTIAGDNGIQLKWTDKSSNESGFRVYRSTDGVNFTLLATVGKGKTGYTDLTAQGGVTYYYGVAAYTPKAQSVLSNISISARQATPQAPHDVQSHDVTENSVSLSWFDDADNESGYHVYRSDDGSNFALVGELGADSNSFVDTGVTAGANYIYTVAPWNEGGEAHSATLSVSTPMPNLNMPPVNMAAASQVAKPIAPSNVKGSNASTTTLEVTWADNSGDEGGFNIYRSTDGVNFYKINYTWANNKWYRDFNLTPGTTYYYKIGAWNGGGETLSDAGTGTTLGTAPKSTTTTSNAVVPKLTAPSTPAAVTFANITTAGLTIKWSDAATNESGYRVYRSTDGTNFSKIADLDANSTSYSDAGLSNNTTYYYKIGAWNATGEATATSSAKTVISAPNAPSTLSVGNPTLSSLLLNWNDSGTTESGYKIYRSTDGANFTLLASLGANATSFTDVNLSSSKTYSYKIAAWNAGGETASVTSEGTTLTPVVAPSAPASVTFANVTTSSLALNWTDTAANETGYRVYRSTDGANFSKIADLGADSTTYSDSNLNNNTTYYYKIAAWNSAAETSTKVSQKTNQSAPNAPANLTVGPATSSSLQLNWADSSSNETGFRIYRSDDGTNFTLIASIGANVTSYADKNLAPSSTFTYVVTAWNAGGETSTLASEGTTDEFIVAPNAPASVTFSNITTTTLSLNWAQATANEDGYRVYRSTDGSNFTKIADLSAGENSYADAGLASNTTYYYKISAWNSAGETTASQVSQKTNLSAPNAPSQLTVSSPTLTSLQLAWSDTSNNETAFNVYRSTDGANFTLVGTLSAGVTSFTDTGLASSKTYSYKITASNAGGETASGINSGTTLTPVVAPDAPASVTFANVTTNAMKINWTDAASNETGYRVYRSADGVTFAKIADLGANSTSYSDSGLTSGGTYYYKISAWNSAAESTTAAVSQKTSIPAPSEPTWLTVAYPTSSKLELYWLDTSNNESGFHIYRSTDGTNFTLIGDAAANATFYADTNLAANTKYTYKVTAWNAGGEKGTWVDDGTTLPVVVTPNAPASLTFAGITTSALSLNWTDSAANETGYHVYRSTDGSNYTKVADLGANASSYADTNLANNTTYYYKIGAWNSAGEATITSSQATKQSAPNAPTQLTVSNPTTSGLKLTWSDSAGNETGYHIYRSTGGGSFTLVGDVTANTSTFSDGNLNSGTTYSYKVSAWNAGGETFSTVTTGTTAQPVTLTTNAPTNVRVSNITTSAVTIDWTDNSNNETSYRVYRSTDGNTFIKVGELNPNTTNFSDGYLNSGTTYYYKIAAVNSYGEVATATFSATTLGTTTPVVINPVAPVTVTAPTAPNTLGFTGLSTTGVTLSWVDTATNESGYHVYRSTDGVNYTKVADLGAAATSYADSGLSSATTYTYKITAWNSAGETAGNAASVTTATPATTPTTLTNGVNIYTRSMTSFTELVIDGTSGNDSILVTQSNGILTITANGQSTTMTNVFGDIVIHGAAGNDTLTVDSSVNIAALLYGGDGNNSIKNLTKGRATIVTIGTGTNTVTGNGINTSYWVNTSDVVNATSAEINLGGVNKVGNFYQPWTTDVNNANYVPRSLNGQNLKDPTDSGSVKRLTESSLWGLGPTMNDIIQTSIADCYYIAPLASLAYAEPLRLMNTGVDLGDGTYAFRFVKNGVTSFVRVDGDLAVGGWYWGLNNATPGSSGNQWGSLMEKAYAFFRNGSNTYNSLNYGFQTTTLLDLGFTTGNVLASQGATSILNLINTNVNTGKAMASNTSNIITPGAPLIASHVYSVIGAFVDSTTGSVMIRLRNPWGTDGAGNDNNSGDGIVTITYAQFAANFSLLTYSTV